LDEKQKIHMDYVVVLDDRQFEQARQVAYALGHGGRGDGPVEAVRRLLIREGVGIFGTNEGVKPTVVMNYFRQ